jgi:tRNA(Met) C34 N-acetyltransferase TmcA
MLAPGLCKDFKVLHLPIRSYYKESHKILGQTFGFLVLQDYEAVTPNLLARTIETVEGGGVVCLLLKNMSSLKQLYTMSMVSGFSAAVRLHVFTVLLHRTFIPDIGQRTIALYSLVSTSDSSCL